MHNNLFSVGGSVFSRSFVSHVVDVCLSCVVAAAVFPLSDVSASAAPAAVHAPAGPPGFFSGGVRHELKVAEDWIGVELDGTGSAEGVEAEYRGRGVVAEGRRGVHHDRKGILVLPVQPGKRMQAETEGVRGKKRSVRVFANGKLDPVVETAEFVIRFKDGVSRTEAEKVLADAGAAVVRELGSYCPNGYLARVLEPDVRGCLEVANGLYGKSNVVFSHPNFIWPKAKRFAPNDPMYGMQWHLNNTGGSGGVEGADVRAERAWEITRGNPNLIIAILDDGLDTGHDEFASSGKITGGWDFVGNDNDARPGTGQNHGTACAGLAAANGDNGVGVSGVAPNCRIMPVRMLGPNSTVEMEAAAISHAKNNGADIISNSWGPEDGTGLAVPCPDVVSAAINDAADNGRGGKGCVILWAAGNGNESADLDGYASHPKVICVAATMRDDTRSPYSDFGNAVTVCAPGGSQAGDMVTVDRMGSTGYSITDYTTGFNGTSAATPVAAGVAALVLSAEPELTRAQVKQRLIDSADFVDTAHATYDSTGHHEWYGFGRVNAWRALGWNDESAPTLNVSTPADGLVASSLTVAEGSATDSGLGIYRVHVRLANRDDGRFWDWDFGVWSTDADGTELELMVTNSVWVVSMPSLVEGNFELQVQAEDKAGNFSPWLVRRFALDNAVPTVAIAVPGAGSAYAALPGASGTAADTGTGVSQVRVALRNQADSAWWNWTANSWGSTTFSWSSSVATAAGTTSWSRALPGLQEGRYELLAQAVDNGNSGSAWASRSFVIDSGPPVLGFAPLTNQAKIFDMADVRGTISEPATVSFRIVEYNVGGTDRYWTGSSWEVNGANSATWLKASVAGNVWMPGAGVSLPKRDQTRYGHYVIEAKAVDRAGGQDSKTLVLIRTAQDTTVPEVAITSPVAGQVFTNSSLPSFTGTASDPESGVAGVSMYLMRLASSGFAYWNGASWTVTPTELPLIVDAASGTWQAPVVAGTGAYPLPSGTSLINGTYQIQITARNREMPAGTRGASVNFVVDYHPVYVWTAGSFSDWDSNNNNNNWDNPENWAPYGVPGREDIAVISGGEPNSTLGAVSVYGVVLNGGTLTSSNITIKRLTVNGGRFACLDRMQLADNGVFYWNGGELFGGAGQTGSFNNPVSGLTVISNTTTKALYNARFNNSGSVRWVGGNINGDESAFVNGPTGTWEAQTESTLNQWAGFGGGRRSFVNFGTFRKVQGFETSHQGYFTNSGVLEVQGGFMTFYDSMTWENGSSLTGAGTARALNGCCGLVCTVTGTVNLNGTFELSDDNTVVTGAGALVTGSNGLLKLAGGYVGGNVDIAGTGSVLWTRGGFFGTNTVNTLVTITGAGDKHLNRPSTPGLPVLNNSATMVWEGPGSILGWARGGYGEQPGVFNNVAGGVFRIVGEGTPFTRDGSEPTFINQPGGLVIKDGSTNEVFINGFVFVNHGEIRAEKGRLSFEGRLNLESNCVMTAVAPLRLNGEINVRGPVQAAGTLLLTGGGMDHARTVSDAPASRWVGPATIHFQGGTLLGHMVLETNMVLKIMDPATGPVTKYLGSRTRINNYGAVTWSGSGSLQAWARQGYGEVPSAITNCPGARFEFLNDGTPFVRDGDYSSFCNLPGGLVVKSGGTNVTLVNAYLFDNAGEVRSETGVLELDDRSLLRDGGRFTGGARHRISGGEHRLFGTNYIEGSTFELRNGTLLGDASTLGTLMTSKAGLFQWTGGTIGEQLAWGKGTSIQIAGADTKILGSGAVLNNYGQVEWSDTGAVWNQARPGYNETPSTWNNQSGALLDAKSDAAFACNGYLPTFNNLSGAVLRKTGGTGTNATVFSWILNNQGVVQAFVDRLDLAAGGVSSGTFAATQPARIRFTEGTHMVNAARFEGTGKFQVDGGTVTTTGSVSFDHTMLEVLSGTLNGSGVLTGTPSLNWTGGTMSGTQTFAAGTVLNISGPARKNLGSSTVINNYGTINWSGPGDILAWARNSYAEYPSTINNLPGATFSMLTDGQPFARDGEYSRFNNYAGALLVKSGGTGETAFHSFALENRGKVAAQSGMLSFVDIANFGDGSVLDSTGILRFAGSITASNSIVAKGTIRLDGGWFRGLKDQTGTNGVVWSGTNTFQWQGGMLFGNLTLNSNVLMDIADPGATRVDKHLGSQTELNNRGQINWSGLGPIYCWARNSYGESPSAINNLPGGVFRLLNDGNPFLRDGDYSGFTNHAGAVLVKTGGTKSSVIDGIRLVNAGELRAQTGVMEYSDVLHLRPGAFLSGAGTHLVSGGNHTLAGSTKLDALLQVSGGAMEGLAGASAAFKAGAGRIEWIGGTLTGDLEFGAGLSTLCSGAGTKALGSGAMLHNRGTLRWIGTGDIWSPTRPGYNEPAASLINEAGAKFFVETDAKFSTWGWPNCFTNQPGALFVKTNSTGITACDWVFENRGTVHMASGTLALNANNSLAPEGTLEILVRSATPATGFGKLSLPGGVTLSGKLRVLFENGFVPESGQSFTVVSYGSRTGQFEPQFPALPFGFQWQTMYQPTDLVLAVQQAPAAVQPTLTSNGQFQFDLTGPVGARYVVEASTNLIHWQSIWTNNAFNGQSQFIDASSQSYPGRFYRLRVEQ